MGGPIPHLKVELDGIENDQQSTPEAQHEALGLWEGEVEGHEEYPGGLCNVILFLFFFFSGLRPWHMEVPRLGAELELELPAYTTAIAMPDPSCVCNLHHS